MNEAPSLATVEQRQHLDDAVRQAGELAAWLQAINEARPCPLVRLAAEMAARLDDTVEAAALAGRRGNPHI